MPDRSRASSSSAAIPSMPRRPIIDLGALVRRVPLSLHLGQHRDETAALCHWHIPESHPLESWGDLRAFDGTVGLRQPATMRLKPG